MRASTNLMSITFTQHLMPNGRRIPLEIDVSVAVQADADELSRRGAWFDVELLSDRLTVSLTCERKDKDDEVEVLAHELVPNGPGMLEAVERLVATAHEAL